jgi:hypothetical protein
MRWPDNSVWEPKDTHNRAPRPALIECEPLHRRRRWRTARWIIKTVLIGGLITVIAFGLAYCAR